MRAEFLCVGDGVGVHVHTLYFLYETATWSHFILYMHISLGGLFNICENGVALYTPWKIMRDFVNFL